MDTQTREQIVIRFAGDSGDGMQLLGTQFTHTAALFGNDLATFPDYPAEIRAPAGTPEGVSGFQVQIADHDIFTPGDRPDVLVAMNPAALMKNIDILRKGGLVVVNSDKFADIDLKKARLATSPLEDDTLSGYKVFKAPISSMVKEAVAVHGLNAKQADRCKNFFALGMMYWLYDRTMENTMRWLEGKFKSPYKEANLAALHAGHAFAETAGFFQSQYLVPPATDLPGGIYRSITGNQALALGVVCASQNAERRLFYGSYPITPATDILHALAPFKNYGVVTFQAEDELAAVCSAIGASYAGAIGVTGTSGPGLALKGEAIGLAMITELPLVVLNVQRGGPSTGLPTKTEQSDLLQAIYGRNGEAPCIVLAPATPSDCFDIAYEAVRLSMRHMMPVIVLSDGYIANGAEPWKIPDLEDLAPIEVAELPAPEDFQPYRRDEKNMARPWASPGMAGYEHRIGGIEKEKLTGNVSYDAQNHHDQCVARADKLLKMRDSIPPTTTHGATSGLLVLSWGSTYGACRSAVDAAVAEGQQVGHVHLRNLNPLPADLAEVLRRYDNVLLPEMNLGQLATLIRAQLMIDVQSFPKLHGQPFTISEITDRIDALLG